MTTFTTDFIAPSVRSRAERLTDGVVAKYIHELTRASGRPARRGAADSAKINRGFGPAGPQPR